MILSDKSILQELEKGNIVISPFNKDHLNPNSVDLTLAPEFKIYTRNFQHCDRDGLPKWISHINAHYIGDGIYRYEEPLDVRKNNPVIEMTIPEEGYVLQPGEVYLYRVNERIGVKNNIRAKVEGKSSLGRLGLFIHVTAGFIDTGFEGSLVLELVATRPIRIYPGQKICQIEFARVEGEVLETYDQKSGSKYHGQTGVQQSKMHENF